ncbi:MAG: hypothetical protein R6V45_07850, partial [Oceanipulchritudo sp.]
VSTVVGKDRRIDGTNGEVVDTVSDRYRANVFKGQFLALFRPVYSRCFNVVVTDGDTEVIIPIGNNNSISVKELTLDLKGRRWPQMGSCLDSLSNKKRR